jgi:deoxycytidylate deaminase
MAYSAAMASVCWRLAVQAAIVSDARLIGQVMK